MLDLFQDQELTSNGKFLCIGQHCSLCSKDTFEKVYICIHCCATMDNTLAGIECIERCNDKFWELTISNLGQSYRKMKCYYEAIVCFEKSISLNPGSYSAKHLSLSGDVDGAIDSYHEALSRKPEDPFSSEMLTRALSEAVTYPRSSVFATIGDNADVNNQKGGIGSSILGGLDRNYSVADDVDMSLA